MSGRKRGHLDDKQFYEIPQAPLGARCSARYHVPVIHSPVFVVRNQFSQERVEALRCDPLIVGKRILLAGSNTTCHYSVFTDHCGGMDHEPCPEVLR